MTARRRLKRRLKPGRERTAVRANEWVREPTWVLSGLASERGHGVPESLDINALRPAELAVLLQLRFITPDELTIEQRREARAVARSEIVETAASMIPKLSSAY